LTDRAHVGNRLIGALNVEFGARHLNSTDARKETGSQLQQAKSRAWRIRHLPHPSQKGPKKRADWNFEVQRGHARGGNSWGPYLLRLGNARIQRSMRPNPTRALMRKIARAELDSEMRGRDEKSANGNHPATRRMMRIQQRPNDPTSH